VVAVRHPAGEGSVSWLTYWTPGIVIETVRAAAAGWLPMASPPRTTSAQSARHAKRRIFSTRHGSFIVAPSGRPSLPERASYLE